VHRCIVFFFAQINQQLEKASGQLEGGIVELQKAVEQYPMLGSTIANILVLSAAIEKQAGDSKQAGDTELPSDSEQQPQASRGEAERIDNQQKEKSSVQSGMPLDNTTQPVASVAGKMGQLFTTTFGWVVSSVLIFFVRLFWQLHRAVIAIVLCALFHRRNVSGSEKCSTRPRTRSGVG
jgi:hypothetical protein